MAVNDTVRLRQVNIYKMPATGYGKVWLEVLYKFGESDVFYMIENGWLSSATHSMIL